MKPVPLKDFKDALSRDAHGITKDEALSQGICIACKGPPRFKTEAGEREYQISGMCEVCWDALFEGDEQ